jgi:hypothetical protein
VRRSSAATACWTAVSPKAPLVRARQAADDRTCGTNPGDPAGIPRREEKRRSESSRRTMAWEPLRNPAGLPVGVHSQGRRCRTTTYRSDPCLRQPIHIAGTSGSARSEATGNILSGTPLRGLLVCPTFCRSAVNAGRTCDCTTAARSRGAPARGVAARPALERAAQAFSRCNGLLDGARLRGIRPQHGPSPTPLTTPRLNASQDVGLAG